MLQLLNLLGLLNRKVIIYAFILSIIAGVFFYQKIKITNLEKQIYKVKVQLKETQSNLKLCRSNNKTFLSNINAKQTVINQLQKEIKYQKRTCQNLLQKKEKLLSDLQKLKAEKPKDIKPTVIVKKECKLKVETGEQLNEKDFIFNTLSNIGK